MRLLATIEPFEHCPSVNFGYTWAWVSEDHKILISSDFNLTAISRSSRLRRAVSIARQVRVILADIDSERLI